MPFSRSTFCFLGVLFAVASCSSSRDLPPPASDSHDPGPTGGGGGDDGGVKVDGGGGGDSGGGTGPSGCFADDKTGFPKCSWAHLKQGGTPDQVNGIPSGTSTETALQLRAVGPDRFASVADCKAQAFGFTLQALGMLEIPQPDAGVYWYLVGADGKWTAAGDGGVIGMVAAYDPASYADAAGASPPSPTYKLDALCDALYTGNSAAIVTVLTVIHNIHDGAKVLEADFVAQHATNASIASGYYLSIAR